MDAVADRSGPDPVTFASLPLALTQRIFLALPVDSRGRACCVSRAWRDVLADPSLWTRLTLAGVRLAQGQSFGTVLLGRARAQLRELDLSQHYFLQDDLLPVLTANAGSLCELRLDSVRSRHILTYSLVGNPTVEAVLAAAPLLQVLTVDFIHCTGNQAPRVLLAQPPFAPLLMRRALAVHFEVLDDGVEAMERFRPFAAALADATLQPALQRLSIWCADTALPQLMGALADAVVARRLPELTLVDVTPPAAAPLARLLAKGSLAVFNLHQRTVPQFDVAGATLVVDALRANTTLTELGLRNAGLCVDVRVACVLLGGLVRHRSLRVLDISGEYTAVENRSAFAAALAALIAADAPALHVLDFSNNSLGDAGLAPILEALALNRHLRELDLRGNGMSEAFERERVLPAVRANTTRELLYIDEDDEDDGDDEPVPAAAEAVE
jgi:hypothetical protein